MKGSRFLFATGRDFRQIRWKKEGKNVVKCFVRKTLMQIFKVRECVFVKNLILFLFYFALLLLSVNLASVEMINVMEREK